MNIKKPKAKNVKLERQVKRRNRMNYDRLIKYMKAHGFGSGSDRIVMMGYVNCLFDMEMLIDGTFAEFRKRGIESV